MCTTRSAVLASQHRTLHTEASKLSVSYQTSHVSPCITLQGKPLNTPLSLSCLIFNLFATDIHGDFKTEGLFACFLTSLDHSFVMWLHTYKAIDPHSLKHLSTYRFHPVMRRVHTNAIFHHPYAQVHTQPLQLRNYNFV